MAGAAVVDTTQLKPDEGTPELPEGRVRVRLHTDGSLHDVTEYEIEKCNPSELDLCEDLSDLQSVNECGVLHTLTSRVKANMPLTHAGPNLVNFWPPLQAHSKTPKSRRGESMWDAPPALSALVKRVYVSMVGSRRDHSVCAVGRSGTGKTTACQSFTHALLKQAGTTGDNISVERVQAMFTVLRSFGCVSSLHSDASSRFASVFSTELQLHQLPEANSFGIVHPTKMFGCFFSEIIMTEQFDRSWVCSSLCCDLSQVKSWGVATVAEGQGPGKLVEEKQRASVAFTKLLTAMGTLGFSAAEQKAIWHVLAGIYHLGAAGACKGNADSSSSSSPSSSSLITHTVSVTSSTHRNTHCYHNNQKLESNLFKCKNKARFNL
ncbi:hypothetical protein INR49_005477 [Caranx melampygus]|nr:hypothetical protein INR49_005477 [Caranx melampygus]